MKKAFFTTIAAIIAFAIFMYFRLGMNKDVALEVRELQTMHVIYMQHTGAYYKISEKLDQVEKWAKTNNVHCPRTFGRYIDDPQTVDEDRLQSQGGCIIQNMPPGLALPEEMKLGTVEAGKYLVGKFDGAPSVGPYTVYPKAFEWVEQNSMTLAGPTVEIYNVVNEKEVLTEYLFPIK